MSTSHRSTRWFRGAALAAAAALVVPACGGDDDNADATVPTTAAPPTTVDATVTTTAPTTSPTTAPTTTMATTTTVAPPTTTGGDDDGTIVITGIDQLPRECVDALSEFLRAVEPIVADIDWDTATLADFENISADLEDEAEILEGQSDRCDDFDFASNEQSLQALIDFAEQEAPGAVGWLEFVGRLGADFDTAGAADGPQTCDEALAYIDGLLAQGMTMSSLPVGELGAVTRAFNVITTDCSVEQADEFFNRQDVADFMG